MKISMEERLLAVCLEVVTEFYKMKNQKNVNCYKQSPKLAYHGLSGSRGEVIRMFLLMKQPACFRGIVEL